MVRVWDTWKLLLRPLLTSSLAPSKAIGETPRASLWRSSTVPGFSGDTVGSGGAHGPGDGGAPSEAGWAPDTAHKTVEYVHVGRFLRNISSPAGSMLLDRTSQRVHDQGEGDLRRRRWRSLAPQTWTRRPWSTLLVHLGFSGGERKKILLNKTQQQGERCFSGKEVGAKQFSHGLANYEKKQYVNIAYILTLEIRH